MRIGAYRALVEVRDEFRLLTRRWTVEHPYLMGLQEALRASLGYEDYRVETPIVYNQALDDIQRGDDVRVILIADNPGKNEQRERNRRYLVGQAGKLAQSWFERELSLDFRKDVLILNKCPVHTPKTAELRKMLSLAGPKREKLALLLHESQLAMAAMAAKLHRAMNRAKRGSDRKAATTALEDGPPLWISGLGELRRGGLFQTYRDELSSLYEAAPESLIRGFWAFNHFSMNQFAIELKRKINPARDFLGELERVGQENRARVFGKNKTA